ncbi:MAG: pyruvate kinase [Candidatus Aenigmarchaeota archaeon]|nr:pyruvate kinase [Candidatus Aenigmarchaeota archaeon]
MPKKLSFFEHDRKHMLSAHDARSAGSRIIAWDTTHGVRGIMRRKTKIIATIGPACADATVLRGMMLAGMDIARLNLSHGTRESHGRHVEMLRAVAGKLGRSVGILFDLQGPELRIENLSEPMQVRKGDTIIFSATNPSGLRLSMDIAPSVQKGDILFLDDGMIRLQVAGVKGGDVSCTVLNSGIIGLRKRLNIPNPPAPGKAVSKRTAEEIRFALAHDPDFIALSYVDSRKDVDDARKLVGGSDTLLVSKLETQHAIANLDGIIEASDAVMVARGDLGMQIPMEKLPIVQHAVVKKCNSKGTPVIVATHMLNSMIENPLPTRAEVNDVTTAVIMGADAVMLSGETAAGKYPVESIQTMGKIACNTEQDVDISHVADSKIEVVSTAQIMSKSLALLAYHKKPEAIIIVTEDSILAKMLSRYRLTIPIYVFTSTEHISREMSLYWGVFPFLQKIPSNYDSCIAAVMATLKRSKLVSKGNDVIVSIHDGVGERMHTIMDIRKVE